MTLPDKHLLLGVDGRLMAIVSAYVDQFGFPSNVGQVAKAVVYFERHVFGERNVFYTLRAFDAWWRQTMKIALNTTDIPEMGKGWSDIMEEDISYVMEEIYVREAGTPPARFTALVDEYRTMTPMAT